MADVNDALAANRAAVIDLVAAAERSAATWTTRRASGKWSPSQVEGFPKALELLKTVGHTSTTLASIEEARIDERYAMVRALLHRTSVTARQQRRLAALLGQPTRYQ